MSTYNLDDLIRYAVNASTEGITISDVELPDNPIIFANEGFELLTGYSKEEVEGRNCRFMQTSDTNEESVSALAKAIQEGTSCTVELLNSKKDGTHFWNRLAITPIRNKDGNVTHFIGIQSDITELQHTKERLQVSNRALEKFKKQISDELDQARYTQQCLLPRSLPKNDVFGMEARFMPMDRIGGDFYDIIRLDEDSYGILLADVTGHGIPAALLSFMTADCFRNAAIHSLSTGVTVKELNRRLCPRMQPGTFVVMFYAVFNTKTRTMTYTQAGNPPALLCRNGQEEPKILSTKSALIGAVESIEYDEKTIQLERGDRILFFTDAVTECMDDSGQMLGVEGIQDFIKSGQFTSLDDMLEQTYRCGIQFSSEKRYNDDCTMLGLELF